MHQMQTHEQLRTRKRRSSSCFVLQQAQQVQKQANKFLYIFYFVQFKWRPSRYNKHYLIDIFVVDILTRHTHKCSHFEKANPFDFDFLFLSIYVEISSPFEGDEYGKEEEKTTIHVGYQPTDRNRASRLMQSPCKHTHMLINILTRENIINNN